MDRENTEATPSLTDSILILKRFYLEQRKYGDDSVSNRKYSKQLLRERRKYGVDSVPDEGNIERTPSRMEKKFKAILGQRKFETTPLRTEEI